MIKFGQDDLVMRSVHLIHLYVIGLAYMMFFAESKMGKL